MISGALKSDYIGKSLPEGYYIVLVRVPREARPMFTTRFIIGSWLL